METIKKVWIVYENIRKGKIVCIRNVRVADLMGKIGLIIFDTGYAFLKSGSEKNSCAHPGIRVWLNREREGFLRHCWYKVLVKDTN